MVQMEERLEAKEPRSVPRDKMIPDAFPHPHPIHAQDKAQQPLPWSRRALLLPGGALARDGDKAPPGLPAWAEAWKVSTGDVGKRQNQRASPGVLSSPRLSRAKSPSEPRNSHHMVW